ncbi:RNA-directed DNA polymerase, eukaryota, reverse transcriptase zinc-binding domain protein [Tanacetum coccineum]
MPYQDEEWRVVGRNRDSFRDRRSSEKYEAIDKVSVSYYITNLPKDIQPREIWNRCASIGTIVDVYVAQKSSKMGRRFGFVRFIRVKNTKEVEKRLCEIWFESYHVFASVARFNRKESNSDRQGYEEKQKEVRVRSHQDGMVNGRSYAKMVSGEKSKNTEQKKEMRSLIIEKKELTGLTEVSSTILAEMCGKFTSNMGIQHLFTRFRSISSNFVVNGRLVWLEISKLPLCAWNSRVFKKIAAVTGDVLFANEDESNSLAIGKVRRIGFMKREKEVGTHGDAKWIGDVEAVNKRNDKGRQITDNVLMVNEIVNSAKKHKKKMMMFKVDFEKAYDSLSWDYLDFLLNGSPTKKFHIHRGLRQGDPLSPFLFILATEGLHILIEDAVQNSQFRGVTVGSLPIHMSHIFYADDAQFMGEWDRDNVESLIRLLNIFYLASRLQLNIQKSKLYGIGVTDVNV